MALIDVTELLSDPDFVDKVQIITRVPSVSSLGEQTLTERVYESIGSVQPASGATIQKLPEAFRVADVMSFFVRQRIVASEPGKYSTVLVFKGQRFQVQVVFDYSNWGQGYSEGTCVREVPAP